MNLTLSTERPATFTIANLKPWTVTLQPVPHERGRFYAISETRFRCIENRCRKLFSKSANSFKVWNGDCPKCGGECERVRYLVNVLEPHGNPRCACEAYTTTMGTACKHCHAAIYLFGKLEAAAAAERQEGP